MCGLLFMLIISALSHFLLVSVEFLVFYCCIRDDCLGKTLDALYDYGVTELFYQLASYAFAVFKIPHKFVHLDTTTFSLYGKYDIEDESDTEVIKITKGYSKDNHPDLNQVVVSMAGRVQ